MELAITSGFLAASAVSCVLLAAIVLIRSRRTAVHWAFIALCADLGLWTTAILLVVRADSVEAAHTYVNACFWFACFMPAAYYTFISLFPRGKFDGSIVLLGILAVSGTLLLLLSLTLESQYVREITLTPGSAPKVRYGPLLSGFSALCALVFISMHFNLYRKLRRSAGIERRQIQHVFLGILTATLTGVLTNVVGPLVGVYDMEPYGPVFIVAMMGFFAYAMVRYHLLDILTILSRTAVFAISSGTVALVFISSVTFVQWALSVFPVVSEDLRTVLPTVIAALVIVLILEPIRERAQLILNRVVMRRRYDLNQFLARVGKTAAECVKLDELLDRVSRDIQSTIGASVVRVMLVDEKDPNSLVTEHSTKPEEKGTVTHEYSALIEHIRASGEALLLEKLVHDRASEQMAQVAEMLAELDAYLCVPLVRTSGLVGIVNCGQKYSRDIYTNEDVTAFTALSSPLATAVENARLYRKLDEANQHRARILGSMRGGVIAVDTDGKITTVNYGVSEILGPVELGAHISQLNPQVANILEQTLTTRRPVLDYETLIVRPDEERVPVVMSSSILTTGEDELSGAMVVIYDLTQVKRLEQNVQRAHRLSSVGTLAAGMAHEIKNPLVSIKTFSQLLPLRYDDPDFRATFTDIVPHEVERIDSIVTRLLHFARPKPATFAPQDLRAIIEEVLVLVENQLRKGNITVETDFPGPRVNIYGDEQQLHQVFLNLVLNAVDAMREKRRGMLRVRVDYERMQVRRGAKGSAPEIDCVKIRVTDTGCGMSSESLERIFTPFYTTKDEGTGLGLSVVHGIVQEHGGTIYVESAPGQETTFVITLPIAHRLSEQKGA
ncbi:MAG: GAF domain-containing protein [Candidatus Hydrogenedentes bacterium]|nr:GAF domain-containing protein [Candidatus Hydrogenedentota bacterium]